MLTSFWKIKELLKKAVELLETGQQLEALDQIKKALILAKLNIFEND